MSLTLNALMRDEAGFVLSAELVLIASILVIGLIVVIFRFWFWATSWIV